MCRWRSAARGTCGATAWCRRKPWRAWRRSWWRRMWQRGLRRLPSWSERLQLVQDGGLLRLVELQVAVAEGLQLLLAQGCPHQAVGPVASADQQVAQFVRHGVAH